MFSKVFLICILYLFCQLPPSLAKKRDRPSGRAIGGVPAFESEVPYIVAILGNNGDAGAQFCGGSILNTKYIISAAHCFVGSGRHPLHEIRILAGAQDLAKRGAMAQLSPVKRVIVHEKYNNPEVYSNDIAIVELERSLSFNRNVQPIAIAPQGTQAFGSAKLSGWGQTQPKRNGAPGGPTSDQLLTVNLTIIPRPECIRLHQQISHGDILYQPADPTAIGVDTPTATFICAGTVPVGGKDACQGDSGGPLQCWRKVCGRKEPYLCGLVSGGYGCGLGLPSWYTDVSQFQSWILKHTNDAQ